MRLSARIRGIVPSGDDGWGILYRARELRGQGVAVTNLSIGDHDWTTPEPIIAAMAASARGGHTGYAALEGTPALRAALAERVARTTGAPTGPGNVIVVPGGQAGLFAAFMATIDPGDRAAIVDPHYATYPETVRAAGGVLARLPARPKNGFEPVQADLDAVLPGCRALLVNSPNNPTGAVYSAETLETIAGAARRHDVWLLSDEVYSGMAWERPHLSPRALPGMAERTLVIGSFSKSHVMTGFRVGWVAGPAEAIERIGDLAIATTYGIPGFIQDAALWALEHGDGIEAETAALYDRRRRRALAALDGCNAVRAVAPHGAMYVMLDVRATGLSGRDFAARLIEEEHIAVMPGESFGDMAAGHLRVALTVEDEALVAALGRLAGFAQRLAG